MSFPSSRGSTTAKETTDTNGVSSGGSGSLSSFSGGDGIMGIFGKKKPKPVEFKEIKQVDFVDRPNFETLQKPKPIYVFGRGHGVVERVRLLLNKEGQPVGRGAYVVVFFNPATDVFEEKRNNGPWFLVNTNDKNIRFPERIFTDLIAVNQIAETQRQENNYTNDIPDSTPVQMRTDEFEKIQTTFGDVKKSTLDADRIAIRFVLNGSPQLASLFQ